MSEKETSASIRARMCSLILFSSLYQEPGSLDAVTAKLEAADPEAGGLMRAFLLYSRGDNVAAAVEARKLLLADRCLETTLGASSILSLEALFQGDTEEWIYARELAAQCDYANHTEYVLKELTLAAQDSALFVKDTIPKWLREGCFEPLPTKYYGIARFLYAKTLYMEARLPELAAAVEPMISESHAEKALLSEIYLRILAAMGGYARGDSRRAKTHIVRALELALPDKLLSPFAEYRRQLGTSLDEALKEMDAASLKTVIDLNNTILHGWTTLYNALYGKNYTNDLTRREYDAARFAMLGLTNSEIADKMGVSINAVKLYLRNVYEKLGISRRDELAPHIWED